LHYFISYLHQTENEIQISDDCQGIVLELKKKYIN